MTEKMQLELDLITRSIIESVPARAIYLFGSHAYGQPHEQSDVDLYVVIPDGEIDTLALAAKIRQRLYKKKSVPLDLLIGKESTFNRRKENLTLENVIADKGVLLYAA